MNLPRIFALAVAVLCGYFLLGGDAPTFTSYAAQENAGYAQGVAAVQYAGLMVNTNAEHPGSEDDQVTPDNPQPSPTPGKCSNCGGTGRVGDGRVSAVCKSCGGDGIVGASKTSTRDDDGSSESPAADPGATSPGPDSAQAATSAAGTKSPACTCEDCDCNPCLCTTKAAAQPVSYGDAVREFTESGAPLVVYVGATWCEPCKQLKPQVEALGHLGNIVYLDADADASMSLKVATAAKKVDARGSYGVPVLVGYLKEDGKPRQFILDSASEARDILNGQRPARFTRPDSVSVEMMRPTVTGTASACGPGGCSTSQSVPVRRRVIRWGR